MDKYTEVILEVDLECHKELQELNHDYTIIPDRIEIKNETSEYQLKIADF